MPLAVKLPPEPNQTLPGSARASRHQVVDYTSSAERFFLFACRDGAARRTLLGIDGLVHVSALPPGYYHRDPSGTELTGERGKRTGPSRRGRW
jgi:hypothetical protein